MACHHNLTTFTITTTITSAAAVAAAAAATTTTTTIYLFNHTFTESFFYKIIMYHLTRIQEGIDNLLL